MSMQPKIVICGAGIAGVAAAYYLTEKYQQRDVLLIDKLPPLSFTTACSGENFREYWPQPTMNAFANHSVRLMEALKRKHGDHFDMVYSGYEFVSHRSDGGIFGTAKALDDSSFEIHDDATQLLKTRPYLDEGIKKVVRATNAGALDVYALGSLLLAQARTGGTRVLQDEITGLDPRGGGIKISLRTGDEIEADHIVLAAGPFIGNLAAMMGCALPVTNVLQQKFVIPDPLQVIPRDMPFTIYADAQRLVWSLEERALLEADPEYRHLLQEFPAGLHIKPEGVDQIKLGWAYNQTPEEPSWQVGPDRQFVELVLRGARRFIPALQAYVDNPPASAAQFAGYYTRTSENLPLIGEVQPGVQAIGALAGYGTMTACAAGELCADNMFGASELPDYASWFSPQRYQDKELMAAISRQGSDGQL
jgi:glycine/D-amino acid oxidase-like deaminating enzyme